MVTRFMPMLHKAWPLVLRRHGPDTKILAFVHPQAGKQFVKGAVARLTEPGATYTSVAGDLDVTVGQGKTWHLEQLAEGSENAIAAREAESAELAQLRKENKRLKEENEIMRKASAFFAQWATKT